MLRDFLVAFACGLCFASPSANALQGTVVGVSDGDTITVLADGKEYKVRLAQIDAPEKSQPFGQVAKKTLSNMTYGKQVTAQLNSIDKYGRVVATVIVDGINVNEAMVESGCAWAYRKYLKDKNLLAIEQSAKHQGLCLWAGPNPEPPWEFRHKEKRPEQNVRPLDTAPVIDASVHNYLNNTATFAGGGGGGSGGGQGVNEINTGPRGGKYYLNSSGNKTYIKK